MILRASNGHCGAERVENVDEIIKLNKNYIFLITNSNNFKFNN